MKYMCTACRTIFDAPWQRDYVRLCRRCRQTQVQPARRKRKSASASAGTAPPAQPAPTNTSKGPSQHVKKDT